MNKEGSYQPAPEMEPDHPVSSRPLNPRRAFQFEDAEAYKSATATLSRMQRNRPTPWAPIPIAEGGTVVMMPVHVANRLERSLKRRRIGFTEVPVGSFSELPPEQQAHLRGLGPKPEKRP